MNNYFSNIKKGFATAFEGLSISLASMLVRPVTVQYPEADISSDESIAKNYKGDLSAMPEHYRGILDLDVSLCISCQLCQKACPIDCVIIQSVKCDKSKLTDKEGVPVKNRFTGKEALKTRVPVRFDIDTSKCMYCGLCALACPTEALRHTKRFEMNKENVEDLVLRFIGEEEKAKAEARAEELELILQAHKKMKAKAKKKAADKKMKTGKKEADKEGAKEAKEQK